MVRLSLRRNLKRLLGRPIYRSSVLVEDHVELKGCSFIGTVFVGMRSYSNDSLFRNAKVGRYCSIGRRCSIGAAKHKVDGLTTHPFGAPEGFNSDPITTIGNDVWIGDNAVIMAGLTIGDGAIIGAGAIVTKDVPPYAIFVGAPAKALRFRFDDMSIVKLCQSEWWNYGDAMVVRYKSQTDTSAVYSITESHNFSVVRPHHKPMLLD